MNGNKRLPLEIERKYLIKMPDVSLLEKQPLYMRIEMEQAYLRDFGDNSGMRIRKSTLNGKTSYKKGEHRAHRGDGTGRAACKTQG